MPTPPWRPSLGAPRRAGTGGGLQGGRRGSPPGACRHSRDTDRDAGSCPRSASGPQAGLWRQPSKSQHHLTGVGSQLGKREHGLRGPCVSSPLPVTRKGDPAGTAAGLGASWNRGGHGTHPRTRPLSPREPPRTVGSPAPSGPRPVLVDNAGPPSALLRSHIRSHPQAGASPTPVPAGRAPLLAGGGVGSAFPDTPRGRAAL